jgi:hypothetical protein
VTQHEDDRATTLARRARRLACDGDPRKAALAMRELVAMDGAPRHWVRLAHYLRCARRADESLGALRQALYLFRREGAHGRARTVARMVLALDPSDAGAARAA